MTIDNGGPAFPQSMVCTEGGGGIVTSDELDLGGMTLRDYFAAKAMQADVSRVGYYQGEHLLYASENAYRMADAMLAARKGGV